MNLKSMPQLGCRLVSLSLICLSLYLGFKLRQKEDNIADLYMLDSWFTYTVGAMLAEGEDAKALKVFDAEAITHVRGITKQYSHHPGAAYWLWQLRAYATMRGLDVPEDVKEIFNKLPKDMPMPDQVYYNTKFD